MTTDESANRFLMVRPPVVIAEAAPGGGATRRGEAVLSGLLIETTVDGPDCLPLFSDDDLAGRYLLESARRGGLKPRVLYERHPLGSWSAMLDQLEWLPAAGVTAVAFDPPGTGPVSCVPIETIIRQLRERLPARTAPDPNREGTEP